MNLGLKGGEERNPKSWGNSYFRITIADIIKYTGGVVAITTFLLGVKEIRKDTHDLKVGQARTITYIKTSLVTRQQADYLWEKAENTHQGFDKRLKRIERDTTIREKEHIDLPDWGGSLPTTWLDAKADGE